jgi:hypothetical protein
MSGAQRLQIVEEVRVLPVERSCRRCLQRSCKRRMRPRRDRADVTIGVLTTGPRSQKACYDVHSSEKSWTAVHKLGGAGGSSKHMPGGECRPYLTQMPGTAGRMLVNFAGTKVRSAGKSFGI